MATLTVETNGAVYSVAFEPGPSLRDILDGTPWRVRSGCGGIGACGLCRIQVLEGAAPPPDPAEAVFLPAEQIAEGRRLACRVRPEGDTRIRILNPAPASHWLTLPADQVPAGRPMHRSGRTLPSDIARPCGVAVDLGTTNICLALHDLASGRCRTTRRSPNPQAAFGADVLTRLCAAAGSAEAAGRMRTSVVEAVAEGLLDVATREGLDLRRVAAVTVVGNTAMLLLLTGGDAATLLDPAGWSRRVAIPPPDAHGWRERWLLNPQAEITVVPPVGGFVGSDLLAGLVAVRLAHQPAPALFIDFGTNSEIALWDGGRLLVTSAAGGPAFEGAGIAAGMPAEPGAVFRIDVENGAPRCRVLGDGPARGLCGSALVDLLAGLRCSGTLSAEGRFPAGSDGVRLAAGDARFHVGKADVDQLQRAKAAIAAGVQALCGRAGVRLREVRRVTVAGQFGRHLRAASAIAIGLLPPVPEDRVDLQGNTALAGCADLMLSDEAAAEAAALGEKAALINLSGDPGFEERFLAGLYLQPMAEA